MQRAHLPLQYLVGYLRNEPRGGVQRMVFYYGYFVKELIRDIDPDAYTKPNLSASTTETKEAKKARREETVRRKAGSARRNGPDCYAVIREAPGT